MTTRNGHKAFFLGGYALFPFLSFKRAALIGLDIQSDEVYLLQMQRNKSGYRVNQFASEVLPEGVMNEGKILQPEALVAAIQTLVFKTKTRGCFAAVALPSHCVIHKEIALASHLTDEECEAVIHSQLDKYFPGIANEICFDFHKQSNHDNVSLIAAKSELVNAYLDVIHQAELYVKIVDVDWCALIRAINPSCKNIAILDVGVKSARILFITNNKMIYAQQLIFVHDFPQLLYQFQQIYQTYLVTHPATAIEKIYLLGKSPYLNEISNYFSENLAVKIEIPNLLIDLLVAPGLEITSKINSSVISLGLAMSRRFKC